MKVLVIIITYNFEAWINRCLGSLAQSDYPVDTIVLDNGSTDQTVHHLQTNYPHIRLIENRANLGFGRANNIGMQIAMTEGYDFVFLMNQDAWVNKDTIGTLVNLCQKHPEYGILSPVHLTASEKTLDPGFASYSQIKEIAKLPSHKEIVPLSFVNAAFWMIPISVLRQIGCFSSLFYHYGEDKDFINRLTFHGYQVGYSPKVFGCHDREYRPMSYQKFLHTEYVYHLSEYANIHYSLPKALGMGVLAVVKKSIESVCKGKMQLSADYLGIAFRLLMQSRHVIACRKTNINRNLYHSFEP